MEILSAEDVLRNGIEFDGDVCYSGEYGQQVYTKEDIDGGIPIEGILYERYNNGNLCYYSFYHDGIPHGQRVRFYETGKVKSCCVMDNGTIDGEHIEWYENGIVKLKEYCKYGLVLKMQEFDEEGNVIKEKIELNESEKAIYEKRVEYYERQKNREEC